MAALNFPNSPLDGDVFQNYKYSAITGTWNLISVSRLKDISNVQISGIPQNNSLLSYSSAISSWVADPSFLMPIGSIGKFGGSSLPSDYIACDGSQISKTTYAKLYSVIKDTYSLGTETTGNFRLPNIAGRLLVGLDGASSEFQYLGQTGGSSTQTLTVNQIPSHTHIQNAHTHIQDAHGHTQDAHSHGISISFNPSGWEAGGYGLRYGGTFYDRCAVTGGWGIGTDSRQPYIQTTVATNNENTATNNPAGSGTAHNNVQPYIVMTFGIKYQ